MYQYFCARQFSVSGEKYDYSDFVPLYSCTCVLYKSWPDFETYMKILRTAHLFLASCLLKMHGFTNVAA